MSKRSSLMIAVESENYTYLREEGWVEVWATLDDWFAGKKFDIRDLGPYIDLLSDYDPTQIVEALRRNASESQFRPKPADVYRMLQTTEARRQEEKDATKDRYGFRKRKDQMPEALVRVRMLVDAGTKICSCEARPTTVRVDKFHILTCMNCGGLEQGQVYAAEDDLDF